MTDDLFACPQCGAVSHFANAYIDLRGNRLCSDECRLLWLEKFEYIEGSLPVMRQMLDAPAPPQLGADDNPNPSDQPDGSAHLSQRLSSRQMT